MRRLFAGLCVAALCGGGTMARGQEADLFDRLDANKDGVVTADEVTEERGKRLFERLVQNADKNGDKKLTKEEFQAGLKDRAPELSPDTARGEPLRRPEGFGPDGPRPPDAKQMAELFNRLDANGDGKLTEDEVPENARGRFKGILERFDDDGDKALTKEQAPRFMMIFMQPSGPPDRGQPQQLMIEQMFKQWDANKDGKLTADEVPAERREQFNRILSRLDTEEKAITKEQFGRVAMAFMAPGGGGPPFGPGMMPGPMAVLRALDGNGDGELSKEEIENAAKALATLDKDKDGKLSREELMPGLAGFPGGLPGGPPGRPGERPVGPPRPDGQPRPEGRPEARPEGRPEGRPAERRGAPNAEQIRARLKEMDTNGDGKISKEEAQGRIKEGFDRIDANSDGFIDEAEAKAALQRVREGAEGRRPEGDRPAGRRPPAEGDNKPKEKEKEKE